MRRYFSLMESIASHDTAHVSFRYSEKRKKGYTVFPVTLERLLKYPGPMTSIKRAGLYFALSNRVEIIFGGTFISTVNQMNLRPIRIYGKCCSSADRTANSHTHALSEPSSAGGKEAARKRRALREVVGGSGGWEGGRRGRHERETSGVAGGRNDRVSWETCKTFRSTGADRTDRIGL